MGDALGEVFFLSALDAESMKEVFDRCDCWASVKFPAAAEGRMAFNCAGLLEEHKLCDSKDTRSQDDLSYEVVDNSHFAIMLFNAHGNQPKLFMSAGRG